MGGWISLIICLSPIYLFYASDHMVLMVISIINSVVNFWSLGVMYNYAMRRNSMWVEQFRKARDLEGRLSPEEEVELRKIGNMLRPDDVPDWLARISIITTILGLILFILYWFIR